MKLRTTLACIGLLLLSVVPVMAQVTTRRENTNAEATILTSAHLRIAGVNTIPYGADVVTRPIVPYGMPVTSEKVRIYENDVVDRENFGHKGESLAKYTLKGDECKIETDKVTGRKFFDLDVNKLAADKKIEPGVSPEITILDYSSGKVYTSVRLFDLLGPTFAAKAYNSVEKANFFLFIEWPFKAYNDTLLFDYTRALNEFMDRSRAMTCVNTDEIINETMRLYRQDVANETNFDTQFGQQKLDLLKDNYISPFLKGDVERRQKEAAALKKQQEADELKRQQDEAARNQKQGDQNPPAKGDKGGFVIDPNKDDAGNPTQPNKEKPAPKQVDPRTVPFKVAIKTDDQGNVVKIVVSNPTKTTMRLHLHSETPFDVMGANGNTKSVTDQVKTLSQNSALGIVKFDFQITISYRKGTTMVYYRVDPDGNITTCEEDNS